MKYRAIDPVEYYIDDDRKIIYVENAKVACTSIKLAIFEPESINPMEIHERLRSKAVYKIPEDKLHYYTFTVVRDPIKRFISCYKDKVLRKGDENTELSIFDLKFYKLIFKVFSSEKYRGKDTDIVIFAKIVDSIPDAFSDRHFRSQYFMKKKANTSIEFVRLEDLSSFWEKMMNFYDLPNLKKENTTFDNYTVSQKQLNEVATILHKRYKLDYERLDLE